MIVGNDLDLAMLEDPDAGVGRAEVNADCRSFGHLGEVIPGGQSKNCLDKEVV